MNTVLRPLFKPDVNLATAKSAGKPLTLDWLALKDLRIDPSFQREITPRGLSTIVKIANEFTWARFSPVMVAPVAGTSVYSIIDGQHRATAALLRGFDKVPCAIGEATAMEQAKIFAAVNGNVTPMTILQLFRAARVGKDEWALAIDRVCEAAGIEALTHATAARLMKPYQTLAIGTLRHAILRFGEAEAIAALKHARLRPGMEEPGMWNSAAIRLAMDEHRAETGKRAPASVDGSTIEQRIRDMKARGASRFAIQAATGKSLADIVRALNEGRS